MKNTFLKFFFLFGSCLLLILLLPVMTFSQTDSLLQRYRNDKKGEYKARKEGTLQKNLISTLFQNNGEIGHWPYSPSGEWPKGSGINNLDGMYAFVSSEVKLKDGSLIHPLETSYREWMDKDPLTGELWGWEPIPGYTSDVNQYHAPAMASNPSTWPVKWPAALGLSSDWNGHFYSYFGKSSPSGIDETFYVIDDSKDGEWKKPPYNFVPVAADSDRGGLGLRVEVRGIQANYLSAMNVLFWNYDVINISDTNYSKSYFGLYADLASGGQDSGPDLAYYNKDLNLVYSWDAKGQTTSGKQVGYTGYAFLQTPGDSAQLGLTALSVYILGDGGVGGGWPKDDESMWLKISSGKFDTQIQNKNISMVMATGPFPLLQAKMTRIASALVFGYDLAGLQLNKNIAQEIYNNNYLFSDTLSFPGFVKSEITFPAKGTSVSGNTEIKWTTSGTYGKTYSEIYYTNDDLNYTLIGADSINFSKMNWNTSGIKDGIFYKLRLMVAAQNGRSYSESNYFTVNNAGNVPPQIKFINFRKDNTLSGIVKINLLAGDADNDPCRINIFYTGDNNLNWEPVATNLQGTDTLYEWETVKFPNSWNGSLMAQITSLADTGTFVIDRLSIGNERNTYFGPDYVTQRHTYGTGTVWLAVINKSEITGHDYVIQFDSLNNLHKLVYNVIDRTTGKTVVSNAQEMLSVIEGPYFDGLRLIMYADTVDLNYKLTGWKAGKSNFLAGVIKNSNIKYSKVFPYDYQIEFLSSNKIPSFDGNNPPSGIPVNFIVKNLTNNDTSSVLVDDRNYNGTFDMGDNFTIVEYTDLNNNGINELPERRYNWNFYYGTYPGQSPIEPQAGDIFQIITTKPFIKGDTLIISTSRLTNVTDSRKVPGEYYISQNYPNPFNPETKIDFEVAKTGKITIKIFDALGREIRTLVNREFNSGRYCITWDGKTETGGNLSSGIYYYQIQASGFTSTKKMIMLK